MKTKADIRASDGDLAPWIRYDALCDWCGRRASFLVDASLPPQLDGDAIYLGGLAGKTREVVCEAHIDERMDAVGDLHRHGSVGIPIRQTWRVWISHLLGFRHYHHWRNE